MDSNDNLLGFVKASANRRAVLRVLYKGKFTPVEISKKSKMLQTNTSRILKQLVSKGLIECTTYGLRKGKLFVLTDQGRAIFEELT